MMWDYNNVGKVVKEAREEMGLTAKEVSIYLGLDYSAISRVEKNIRGLTEDEAQGLRHLFGKNIFKGFEKPKPAAILNVWFVWDDTAGSFLKNEDGNPYAFNSYHDAVWMAHDMRSKWKKEVEAMTLNEILDKYERTHKRRHIR